MQLLRERPWYLTAVVALLCITGFYATYHLTESPATWYDEGLYIQVAQSVVEHGSQSIQVAPGTNISSGFITGGYPFLLPIALSLKIFGNTLLAARLPMVAFVLLFVGAAFYLLYRHTGRSNTLLGLALLVTLPLLYGNGKNVLGEIPGMVFVLFSLVVLTRLEGRHFRGAWDCAAFGVYTGLAVATKPIFLLLPLAYVFVYLRCAREIPMYKKEFLFGLCGFLLPVGLWGFLQFGQSDSLSAVVAHYTNPYAVVSLTDTVFANAYRFFTEMTPLYCGLTMLVWSAALWVRRRRRVSLVETSAFIFSLLVLAAYLRTAGWYRYFFEAFVLTLMFLPYSLTLLYAEIQKKWRIFSRYTLLVPGVCLVLVAVQFYQLNYTSWVAETYASTKTASIEAYMSTLPTDASVFVYNAPELVPFLETGEYYQYIEDTPVTAQGASSLTYLEQGVPTLVMVHPSIIAQKPQLFTHYQDRGQTVGGYTVLTR